MAPIPKILGVISCSIVLSLSLAYATQAKEKRMPPDPCAERKGGQPALLKCDAEMRPGIETINGQVLRLDGGDYVVQMLDGKETRLRVDQKTQVTGVINRGDYIEAKVGEVNEQKHVQSIREIKK